MARRGIRIHQAVAIAIALTLAAPVVSLADGKKHFKEGMKYEANRQWDKAAEQFALALADSPSNVEYDLHLRRSLVQAAIMLVERGDTLAEKRDYNAAYTAYRQAFSFDPTNELALIKMRRMLEVQGLPTNDLPRPGDPSGPKIKPAARDEKAGMVQGVSYNPTKVQVPGIPERRFSRTDVIYRDTNLQTAIEQLAQVMKINVMFDHQVINTLKAQRATIELRDVTYPRALEMLLKTHGLMYAQLDSRTIVVAADNVQARQKYEPYAVRTFYIKNADATEMKGSINGALPQVKQMTPVKQLNALVVRDTPSNLELVEQMINSLDKSKAEVLVDVNIYEVSRNDLLQLGNQFATPDTKGTVNLGNLGGLGNNAVIDNAARAHTFIGALAGAATPLGFALGLPPSSISFFQDKGKTKLLASTQVHVLDTEQNTVRIGQRVPIQTASLPTFTGVSVSDQNRANRQAGLTSSELSAGVGGAFLGGIPQIQYENVGLNIDVTPQVYEDEVQMKMKIETTSIDRSTGTLTPTFNQRTMTSVARVKDGQTTLIAGVSSSEDSKEIKGIPLIGLIPILGRFFATPQTTNKQSDVVITVTPHILRRADITEEDHLARAAGDFQSPNNQLRIAQILYLADLEDQQQNQVASTEPAPAPVKPVIEGPPAATARPETPGVVVKPVPTMAPPSRPNIIRQTVSQPGAPSDPPTAQPVKPESQSVLDDDDDDDDDDEETPAQANQQGPVTVYVRPASPIQARGQDLYVAIFVNGPGDITSARIGLNYDSNILEVKGVRDSGLMSVGARAELQFQNEPGSVTIEITRPQGSNGVAPRGQLCLIVFTTKAAGQSTLVLNEAQTSFHSAEGLTPGVKLQSSQVEIRQ